MCRTYKILISVAVIYLNLFIVRCENITDLVFSNYSSGAVVAAFGDFNSDELTDIFIITNKSRTFQILYASNSEPLLRHGPNCTYKNHYITSIVPGDFDGDALMDVMVTLIEEDSENHNILKVYINWGGSTYINCSNEDLPPVLITYGEPITLDYNHDMIIDLFGINANGLSNFEREQSRTYWIFKEHRVPPQVIRVGTSDSKSFLKTPHSHAYIDLNNDFCADLYLQTKTGAEIWLCEPENNSLIFSNNTFPKIIGSNYIMGHTLFMDMELTGHIHTLIPICFNDDCSNSTIVIPNGESFHNLNINFKDDDNNAWGFIPPNSNNKLNYYNETIMLRSGDYNLDGYPDILTTLRKINDYKQVQTVLLENVQCTSCKGSYKRTFKINWKKFRGMGNNSITGIFYDFFMDGTLDVIFIQKDINGFYRPYAFKNDLYNDAYFLKVIVLTGRTNSQNPNEITPLGIRQKKYGTNLPGPKIIYWTTTLTGEIQHGTSSQLPQSAYLALNLPYSIFGLGRTSNFVDSLTVGIKNKTKSWTQTIPNSQLIVVPANLDEPSTWKAHLIITPSKLIKKSVFALTATCVVITVVIILLYLKERRQDKIERQSNMNRFHYY